MCSRQGYELRTLPLLVNQNAGNLVTAVCILIALEEFCDQRMMGLAAGKKISSDVKFSEKKTIMQRTFHLVMCVHRGHQNVVRHITAYILAMHVTHSLFLPQMIKENPLKMLLKTTLFFILVQFYFQ